MKELKVGHGAAPGTTAGPLINGAGVLKVRRHVDDAIEKGATLLCGGSGEGNFFEPTLLTGCDASMACFKEETFGPLAAIAKFDTEAEAVAIANDASVGLAAYFCSKDLA